jgi:hypothetical protein
MIPPINSPQKTTMKQKVAKNSEKQKATPNTPNTTQRKKKQREINNIEINRKIRHHRNADITPTSDIK